MKRRLFHSMFSLSLIFVPLLSQVEALRAALLPTAPVASSFSTLAPANRQSLVQLQDGDLEETALTFVMEITSGKFDDARLPLKIVDKTLEDPVLNRPTFGADTPFTTGPITASGTVTTPAFVGNGAGITGLTGATGEVANTGSTTIGADTDGNGIGIIDEQINSVTKRRRNNGGAADLIGGIASFTKARLPAAGNARRIARVVDDIRRLWRDSGRHRVSIRAVNVLDFGLKCDGSTDNTAAWVTLMAEVPAGSKVNFPACASYYKFAGEAVVNKALTITGKDAELRQVTSNTKLLKVTASNVTIDGLKLVGPQFATFRVDERAISIEGTNNAPLAPTNIRNIKVVGTQISNWGGYAIYARHVENLDVSASSRIKDIYYCGVCMHSVIGGKVVDSEVKNIIGSLTDNAYGIAASRYSSDAGDLVSNPHSSNIQVERNLVDGVVNWEGVDAHAAQGVTFANNRILNTKNCIVAGVSKNSAGVVTYAPQNVKITGNTCDSKVTNGSRDTGIKLVGVSASVQASGEITNNTIIGHGLQSENTNSAAIWLNHTQGVPVNHNKIYQPSPIGITFFSNNTGAQAVGNEILDPWSTDSTFVAGIMLRGTPNTVQIGSNTIRTTGRSASVLLTTSRKGYGVRVIDDVTNRVDLGANDITADTKVYATSKARVTANLAGGLTGGNSAKVHDILHGTATFTAAISVTVTFATPLPDATYRVAAAPSRDIHWWITGKTVNGFTIEVPSAFTGTVDWQVVR